MSQNIPIIQNNRTSVNRAVMIAMEIKTTHGLYSVIVAHGQNIPIRCGNLIYKKTVRLQHPCSPTNSGNLYILTTNLRHPRMQYPFWS